MVALHVGTESSSVWTAWSPDPVSLILILVALILYHRGINNLQGRRLFHATWRPWSFYAGLFALSVALLSPIDHLSGELFAVHMVQHMLILMVGAPLVLLGAPILPILRGIPRSFRRVMIIPIAKTLIVRSFLRTITRPLVAWPLYTFIIIVWHFPVFFVAAIENEVVHFFEHFLFGVGAYVFWWNIIDPMPLRSNLSYLARIPYIFISVVPAFVLGAFLTFAGEPWYAPYTESTIAYGLTHLEDQQLGGIIMWVPGSFIIGTALMITLYLTVKQEQKQQTSYEQESAQQ